jgi:predicted RNA binding protein YcfA (HicA-like mRNA interferase family)
MPKKIRDLIQNLKDAGFSEIVGGGKGSHRKFIHSKYAGAVTVSGQWRCCINRKISNNINML